MEAFLVSTLVVAVGEIGDKTQILALLLAARFKRPVPIIFGILAAKVFNHALAGLLGSWIRSAVGPEVRDTAGLFSTSALKQADETIRGIQREFHKDLLVETFAGVPENRKEDYNRGREEFFAGFVRERAQEARLDGE